MAENLTNEELASLIRKGDDGYLPQLWDQVRRFIAMKAERFLRLYLNINGWAPFDLDDLICEAYIAVVKAAKRHDPDKGHFLTYLDFYLRTAFREVAGIKTTKRDAVDNAVSLDAPLASDEDGKSTLYDRISLDAMDPNIVDESSIDGVMESIYTYELRQALENALMQIPNAEARALRLRYFFGVSYTDQAELGGKSMQYYSDLGMRGIWHIRGNEKVMFELIGFLNPDEAELSIAREFGYADNCVPDNEFESYLL